MVTLVIVIFGFIFWQNSQRIASISTFQECADAGNPIMETFPEQCVTPDGRSFTRELTEEEKLKLMPPSEQLSCGDGICQEVTCDAIGCPQPESPTSCPQDCPFDR